MPEAKFLHFQMFTKVLKVGMFGLSKKKKHVNMYLFSMILHCHAVKGLLHVTAEN